MASPFHSFRRHQKKFLAFLCVALMVTFVFTGVTCDPRSGNDQVVAEANFGPIYRSKLDELRRARNIANDFMARLIGQQPFGSADDQSLIDAYLMAHKAQELGMVVTDDAVRQFIDDFAIFFGMQEMPRERINSILDQLNITQAQLFAALRIELQSTWFIQQYFAPAFTEARTPAERWRIYQRLHRQVNAQALAVPVDAFMDQVSDPGDDTLREFFQRYKDRDFNPDFPDPGFRQPQRASLQYVVADFTPVYEEAKAAITDEEIQSYYNENQQLFPYSGFQDVAPSTDPRGDSPATPMPAPGGGAAGGTNGPVDGGSVNPSSGGNTPAGTNPPSPGDGAAPATDTPATPATGPALGGNSADNPATPDTTPAGGDTPPATGGDTPPATSPATGPVKEPLPDRETLQELVRNYLRYPQQVLGGPDPQFDPLWKVKDDIRELLARRRAEDWILNGRGGSDTGLRGIRAKLAPLGTEWRNADIRLAEQTDELQAIRKKLEAQAVQIVEAAMQPNYTLKGPTKSLTLREVLSDTDIGKSNRLPNSADAVAPPETDPFANAFRRLTLFEPGISQSTAGASELFLFWKVNERLPYVPEKMEDVREQVLTAWKRIEARKLAMAEAQRLEGEARKANKPLTEISFAGASGVNLTPVTWMREVPNQFQQRTVQRSQMPEELQTPGLDLEKTLFGLNPGEFGVAYNQPQTVVYVLHMTGASYVMGGREISDQLAHAIFMAEPFSSYAQAGQLEFFELNQEFTSELRREYELEYTDAFRAPEF